MIRDNSRNIIKNKELVHESLKKIRGVKTLSHLETPHFLNPSEDLISEMNVVEHVWTIGDRFYKLADEYYGSPQHWWVIARFNSMPTEAHVKIGDVVLIPTSLELLMPIYNLQGEA